LKIVNNFKILTKNLLALLHMGIVENKNSFEEMIL